MSAWTSAGPARAEVMNQRLSAAGRPGPGGRALVDLDRAVHPALALQLDVPVLPASHGLALSWVGSGRLIFSLNYGDEDFEAVVQRFVEAGREMLADGWWWDSPQLTNRGIRRGILGEMLRQRL